MLPEEPEEEELLVHLCQVVLEQVYIAEGWQSDFPQTVRGIDNASPQDWQ